jgi:tripartite-type tricarboxylate transporter receptor subunit TctC
MRRLASTFCLTLGITLTGCTVQSGTDISKTSEGYPHKTVTVICPWAAGGGTDRVARFWADALEKEFGQPFVVVNKTGGSGAVGHTAGAYARPDGHTITLITFELCTMHRMNICDLTYNDFACIMQMNADAAVIVVRDDAPWKTLGELLDYVRENPGEVKMSGTATGGAWDLARAGLLDAAGVPIDSVVWVPEKGAAPSLVQLLGGHIDAVCCSVPEALTQVEAGQLRMLAVMSDERHSDFPDVPTAKESGVDWTAVAWRGLALPKETPPEIVDTIYKKCARIVESDEYKEFMRKNGFAITVRAKDDFTQFLAEQDAQWNKVIETAGYAK